MSQIVYLVGIGAAVVFVSIFIVCLIFQRRLGLERSLDPRCDQLVIVQKGKYHKRRLLNGEEYQLFKMLEDWIASQQGPHRLFAQVSLGEILGSEGKLAYACVNSKRCDFVVVDGRGYPVVAIEYQGAGHYGSNSDERDFVKQKALESAGVQLVQVFDDFIWADVRAELEHAISVCLTADA